MQKEIERENLLCESFLPFVFNQLCFQYLPRSIFSSLSLVNRDFLAVVRNIRSLIQLDFTLGKEKNPISCHNNIDCQLFPEISFYVTKNEIPIQLSLYEGCRCETVCDSIDCSCIRKSKFVPYTTQGQLNPLLEDKYANLLIFECHENCHCNETCYNRVVSRLSNIKLRLEKKENKGWSVIAAQEINKGTFISEYVGEVITMKESRKRENDYKNSKNNYLLIFREHLSSYNRILSSAIDATNNGNFSRFFNHSCNPNLSVIAVRTLDIFPHVSFFSNRYIGVGEELCFNYGSTQEVADDATQLSKTKCYCGEKNCLNFLPADSY